MHLPSCLQFWLVAALRLGDARCWVCWVTAQKTAPKTASKVHTEASPPTAPLKELVEARRGSLLTRPCSVSQSRPPASSLTWASNLAHVVTPGNSTLGHRAS